LLTGESRDQTYPESTKLSLPRLLYLAEAFLLEALGKNTANPFFVEDEGG
jgi:hypothetical protein